MFNNLENWYYPKTIDEALSLLKRGEIVPHAGGTGILRIKSNRISGLVDLQKLPLNYLKEDNDFFYIGAGTTLAQLCSWNRITGAASILQKAASMVASTPLRNRITIGGSIASPAPWSDFPPVLLALDATVELKGSAAGMYPAKQYFQNIPIDGTSLITEIKIPKLPGKAVFERVTQTKFDYSLLDLALYISEKENIIENVRIAIGCAVPRAIRLIEVENYLTNRPISDKLIQEAIQKTDFNPSADRRVSKEYRMQLLKILMQRNLEALLLQDA